jgi:transcription elongation factor GreA
LDVSLVTPAGLDKLSAELRLLRSIRKTLVAGIRSGLDDMGDRRVSGKFLDARDRLAQLDQQIALLEDKLISAKVIHADPADGEVGIGEGVRVRDLDGSEVIDYRIVGVGEADPGAGCITYLSPVGSALLGRHVGDVIELETPRGLLRLEVLEAGF